MIGLKWETVYSYLKYEKGISDNPANLYVYKSRFLKLYQWFHSNEKRFTHADVIDFLRYIQDKENASQSTINKYISLLKNLGRILKKKDVMDGIIQRKEDIPSYVVLTLQEQELILKTHPVRKKFNIFSQSVALRLTREYNYRMDCLLEFQLKNGLRFSELRNLSWQNWHENHFIIYGGKTRRFRKVPVIPELARKLLKLPRFPHGYVFGSDRGQLDNHTINNEIKSRLSLLGIKSNCDTVKGFRTTCATTDLQAGAPIERVAKKLGHANIQMTYERYYKPILDDLIEIAYMHPLNTKYAQTQVIKGWVRALVSRLKDNKHCDIYKYKESDNRIILDLLLNI